MREPIPNLRLGRFIETPVAGEMVRAFVPPPEPDGERDVRSYETIEDSDEGIDTLFEIREGEVETIIPADYESKSVAAKLPDGSWVGWTYWYGGGKHGDPALSGLAKLTTWTVPKKKSL